MAASRSASIGALFLLLIALLLSPDNVAAKIRVYGRKDKNASDRDDASESAVGGTSTVKSVEVCDEIMARSVVMANEEKAAVIVERDEALASMKTAEERIAELEQVS